MDNKVLSTSLSLACHTIFLIIALNMVFTPSSESEPVSPPVLIHVHLDYRPYSPSLGNMGKPAVVKKPLNVAPPMKMKKISRPSLPPASAKPVVSNDNVVTIVKPNVPSVHAPSPRQTQKTTASAKQVFKDVKAAQQKMAASSSVMPMSDISNQMQQMQVVPSLQSAMQNTQGESPYLPFDQNGSGTDIKAFLGYDLFTYEDPQDHAKYFKLSIRVEDIPGTLTPMPKEITFLVDASGSIGPKLLRDFKDGVGKCLQQLAPDDKFNVMVFNDSVSKMQEESVPNTPSNVQKAQEFLEPFQSVSETDLYDTVLNSAQGLHTMKPSYVLLLSDGQPTKGITDSLQLINKIGAVDKGAVPIFGFGGGAYNQYLMNFLSFTNHAWAEFDAAGDTSQNILQMYGHIKDPVLMNVRYYSSGLDTKEIYPKLLPDLFKDSEFVLYGRYDRGGDFLFQLRGDSLKDVKQYLIKDNLNNGQQGDRSIAQEWAMRKIFHLIGQLQYDEDNQAIIDQINELASKFDLKIPQYKVK